jgi:hypothetical protein
MRTSIGRLEPLMPPYLAHGELHRTVFWNDLTLCNLSGSREPIFRRRKACIPKDIPEILLYLEQGL